jgi:hypothetical protein
MSSKQKLLNYILLILLIAHSSICESLRKSKTATNTNTETYSSTLLGKWDPKWQFELENGKIKIYEDRYKCKEKCKFCYRVKKWADLYFNVLKDRKKAVCTIKAEPVDENKKTDPAKPKTETTWDYEDLCNAFCQPMYKLRCVFTKICHPRTDTDCRDPIFRYVC